MEGVEVVQLDIHPEPEANESEPHTGDDLEMRVVDGPDFVHVGYTGGNERYVDQAFPHMVARGVNAGSTLKMELHAVPAQ